MRSTSRSAWIADDGWKILSGSCLLVAVRKHLRLGFQPQARSGEKRRRAAAVQDAGAKFRRPMNGTKRLGVRQRAGALAKIALVAGAFGVTVSAAMKIKIHHEHC